MATVQAVTADIIYNLVFVSRMIAIALNMDMLIPQANGLHHGLRDANKSVNNATTVITSTESTNVSLYHHTVKTPLVKENAQTVATVITSKTVSV